MLEYLDDDIICEIARVIPPSDVISFALVSRRIHLLSSARLREHRDYKKNYSELWIGRTDLNDWGLWSFTSPLSALYEFSIDPWKAYYVRRLHYDNEGDGDGHLSHEETDTFETWEWFAGGVPKCIKHAAFLTSQQRTYWYCDILCSLENILWEEDVDMEDEEQSCTCGKSSILLMSLLPNLELFHIEGNTPWHFEMSPLIQFAKTASNEPTSHSSAPLSKLRTVHVEGSSTIVPMMSLVSLPSVHQLFVSRLNEYVTGSPGMALHVLEHYSPNLSVIGIGASFLAPDFVEAVVAASPKLQRLSIGLEDDAIFPCGEIAGEMSDKQFIGHSVGDSADIVRKRGLTMYHWGSDRDETATDGSEDEECSTSEDDSDDVDMEDNEFFGLRVLDFKVDHKKHAICEWLSLPCANEHPDPVEEPEINLLDLIG